MTKEQLKKQLLEHIFFTKASKIKLPCDVANSHILG